MNNGLWWLVVVFVVLAVLGAVAMRARNRQKDTAYTTLAQQYGWRYLAEDPQLPARFTGEPFGTGHYRKARFVLSGQYRGYPMVAFDYSFSPPGDGEGSSPTHRYSVVVLTTRPPTPQLAAQLPANQRFEGASLITWIRGRMDATKLMGLLNSTCDALDQVPPHLWQG
ncbi:hypothetical protein [Actinocrispum wychmicini]|uniref:Uncharacterized protein n=1 Tax=Actinocrispum wychmicini TaxID=1213861 RepID=A0A4R2K4X7_9PSEU|nr:hypothetical protein [Actinocrispum wychmicini]TCO64838.1 hypothetical protein EV192_101622 [Actinocrispum wychmicini]